MPEMTVRYRVHMAEVKKPSITYTRNGGQSDDLAAGRKYFGALRQVHGPVSAEVVGLTGAAVAVVRVGAAGAAVARAVPVC